MSLDSIVQLTIRIASGGVDREGFGLQMIADYHTRFAGRAVKYTSIKALTDAGWATTDRGYQAANIAFSQDPKPPAVWMGRLALSAAQQFTLTPATAVSTVYSVNLAIAGGSEQTASYTSSATANSAEILTGLSAAIAALSSYSGNIVAATAAGVVTITGAAGAKWFRPSTVSSTFSAWKDTTTDAGIATDLAAIEAEQSKDWYFLNITAKGDAVTSAAAAWTEARRKMFVAAANNADIGGSGTSDLASTLKTAAYARTVLLVNDDHMAQPDAGLAALWGRYDPGSETLKFKTIKGIESTAWSATFITNFITKRANYYVDEGGTNIIQEGITPSGEFADVIRFVDWIYVEMQAQCYSSLKKNPKLPFTNEGITVIEGDIRSVLQRGQRAGGLSTDVDFTVTVPDISEVGTLDKAARLLTPISFSATLAGAIHAVAINGTVSV